MSESAALWKRAVSFCLALAAMKLQGVKFLMLNRRKALWTVRAPLSGNEFPVTGGVPREAECP